MTWKLQLQSGKILLASVGGKALTRIETIAARLGFMLFVFDCLSWCHLGL